MLRLFLVSQREKLFLFPSCERLPFSKAQSEGAKRSCRHLPTQDLDGCHTYDHITMAIRHQTWPPASPRYWTRPQIPNYPRTQRSSVLLIMGLMNKSTGTQSGGWTGGHLKPCSFQRFFSPHQPCHPSCKIQFKFYLVHKPFSQLIKCSEISSLSIPK